MQIPNVTMTIYAAHARQAQQFVADKTKLRELTQAINGSIATYPVVIWPVGLQPR